MVTPTLNDVDKQARMLIICPLADIYSGVGNFGAPPLGPWRLTGWLRQHGQHVDIWDCNVSKNLRLPAPEEHAGRDRAEVLAGAFVTAIEADFDVASYEWIGFSILSDTLPTTLGVINLFRKGYPKTKLVGGNHESTVNLNDCLNKSQLDGVLLADAEDSMLSLMQGAAPHTVPGVIWRTFQPKPPREKFEAWNQAIPWGEMPYKVGYWDKTAALYPLDSMPPEERLAKEREVRAVRIHSLNACELACTYCSVANTRRIASGSNKPSIINLSPNALRETLLTVKRRVPDVMTIYDSCDEAWLGRGRAEEYLAVLESIREEMDAGLPDGMRYLIQCRSQDLDEEIIDRASRVGVRHLTVGVESPIERVRKTIKKPQSEELVRNIAKWCTARGVDAYMLFIMFLPEITLEELREAVMNWRIYMDLGATVSVEPFCMAYLGTTLHDDASYLMEYAGYEIPFSGTPAKRLKWATLIWPTDRRVCAIEQWFRDHVDEYIAEALKKLGHKHAFKGTTGRVTVDCLEEALRQWDLGNIPPWEPGEGRKTSVYQSYGDQASGVEVANMVRANKTASRFNSTHALLDDPNAGIKGRVKDPALPHEMAPAPDVLASNLTRNLKKE